jgi:hypothetical protein
MTTTKSTQTLDHLTEGDLVADTAHDTGCWEWFAEELIEAAPNFTGAGRHDDRIDGRTLWQHFLDAIEHGTLDCHCED